MIAISLKKKKHMIAIILQKTYDSDKNGITSYTILNNLLVKK